MFDKIEELYKKNSLYNKIKIRIFWFSFFMTLLLWFLSLINLYIMMIFGLLISFVVFKKICEKTVNINFSKISHKEQSLNEIINFRDKNKIKNFIIEEGIYTKENLNNITEHYRTYIKSKIVGDNFWTIISIIVSVSLAFISKDGFDVNGFKKSFPYLISLTILIVMVCYTIKNIIKFKKILNGEDGVYERLEMIFSELYIEYEKDARINKKRKSSVNKFKEKK